MNVDYTIISSHSVLTILDILICWIFILFRITRPTITYNGFKDALNSIKITLRAYRVYEKVSTEIIGTYEYIVFTYSNTKIKVSI